jgi:Asp/Glu/hydantoin racemase
MTKRIAVISVAPIAMQPVADAFARLWPEAECDNILDDGLFRERGKTDDLKQPLFDRIVQLGDYARSAGADGILYTCSAFGAAIEAVQQRFAMPVLKPNEAMFEAALDAGTRIGMLATAPFAVAQLEQEFRDMAAARESKATLTTRLVDGAMIALTQGDAQTHNRLIAEAAPDLDGCDAVILAHFSTSRAEPLVATRIKAPVLTAPGAAVLKLKRALKA